MTETSLLVFLTSLLCCDANQASLTVSPSSSQFFQWTSFSMRCDMGDNSTGWTIRRSTADGRGDCGVTWGRVAGSSCKVGITVPWDSGVYWCESGDGAISNNINVTVTDKSVLLQSPVLPVMEGHNLTVLCKAKSPASNPSADFFKDGSFLRAEPEGHMTIQHVAMSDQGLYTCRMSGHGESPPSWISVSGNPRPRAVPPASTLQLCLTLLLYLLVICPYFISTLLMVSLYRSRPTGSELDSFKVLTRPTQAEKEMSDNHHVTTEHHF